MSDAKRTVEEKTLGCLAAFVWGITSFVLLHPLWYTIVDGPHWVGPVDVVGTWDAPWYVRHSYVPFWLVVWLSMSVGVWGALTVLGRRRSRP